MMRSIPLRLAALLPLFLAACGDLPTSSPAPEVTVADRLLDCYRIDPETVRCSDEEPIWDDECDPYHYDCGADDCIESTGGGDVESTSMQGCPPPAGGGSTGGPTPGPGGPGTGGDDGTECNPQYDPDCNQPLTPADSATLRTGFQRHINTVFTDPAKAAQCTQLKNEFDRLMTSGSVYRGEFDTPANDPHTAVHVGAYDPVSGTMHFEPSALDAANAGDRAAIRNIVNTALHEAAHSLRYDHTDPVWMGSYDLYAESPFDLLSPGINSCITGW